MMIVIGSTSKGGVLGERQVWILEGTFWFFVP
jgi:hypothetical protein